MLQNERRIAKNTLLLFIRMGIIMVLNLLAVRFVRQGLGIEDYGIFNAIAGLVNLLLCFNTVMATASQRYLSVRMGENDEQGQRDVFLVSQQLCRWIAIGAFIIFETIGLWFIISKMNYPAERLGAVLICYQMTIVTFICMMLQIPYLAAVMAHEKMGVFACISLLECFLKFTLALAILICPWDKMAVYGIGLALFSCISTTLYVWYVRKRFPLLTQFPSSSVPVLSGLRKELIHFMGWTMFGSLAGVCITQGQMILLNIYHGPVANAAFAIALQIYGAFSAFGNNIILAARPQMVMNYADGNFKQVKRLFWLSTAAMLGACLIVAVPLEIWMNEILTIWLGEVDALTISLSRLIIAAILILLMGAPVTVVMQASGRVKEYHLPVETATLLILPFSWIMLANGYAAEWVCYSLIIGCAAAHLIRLIVLFRYAYKQ